MSYRFFFDGQFGVIPKMSPRDSEDFMCECYRVIRNWRDTKWTILASCVTEKWRDLCLKREPTRIFRQMKNGALETKVAPFSPSSLVSEGPFGVLISTNFSTYTDEPVYIFVWIQKDTSAYYRMVATFDITDNNATPFRIQRCKINPLDFTNLKFALRHLRGDFSFDEFEISLFAFLKQHFLQNRNDDAPFDFDTGFVIENDVFGDDIPKKAPIKLQFSCSPDSDETWDIFLFFNEERDPLLSVIDCLPSLFRIIRPSAFNWGELGSLVDTSNWGVNGDDQLKETALKTYLEFTFERLYSDFQTEDASRFPPFVPPLPQKHGELPESLLFCTGLVECQTGKTNFIYGKASDIRPEDDRYGSIEWLFHKDPKRQPNPLLRGNVEISPLNHGLPYPADWTREPERLIFEYRFGSLEQRDVRIDYAHLFFDHLVEERLLVNEKKRFPDFITKQFDDFDLSTVPSWCHGISRSDYVPRKFKTLIDSAWRKTRKLLQSNYKIAVPTYFRRKIQILVPLYLDVENNPNVPTVALVVSRNDDEEKKRYGCTYFCPTCLSLDSARNNSRVIMPLQGTWLGV